MTPIPPTGSKITVRTDDGDPVIVIPYAAGDLARYGGGIFLLCWFAAWTVALIFVGTQIVFGFAHGGAAAFMVFWFAAAMVAEIFVGYILLRMFGPQVPETFRLKRGSLLYDSGLLPPQMSYGYVSQRDRWKSAFPKRTIVEIDRKGLQTLRLRDTDSGNRLTADVNATRLELAVNGSEVEREWLYQLIADRYALDNTQAARP
jgi:hypothetical protein